MNSAARRLHAPFAHLDPIRLAGQTSSLVTLDSGGAFSARLLGYGASVIALECPDRAGRIENVVLGFRDPDRYLGEHPYFGATVGRFANRIHGARFVLEGREVQLEPNDHGNQLHGGPHGFSRSFFEAGIFSGEDHAGVAFTRRSPAGEGGYPGNLDVRVEYRLFASGALRIDFSAETDAPTVVNLSHHGYFDLSGCGRGIREQTLWIGAERYVPLDGQGIPTGGTRAVEGGPFDFREAHAIGLHLGDRELAPRRGYDHPFVVLSRRGELTHVARLRDPSTGRRLDLLSTEPILHLYTGQLLDPHVTGHEPFSALCLETGRAPDTPNQPDLGNCRLLPGERYEHSVIYKLGVDG